MSAGLRTGFCVSGAGWLFRAAVEHSGALGITPVLLILDRNASPDLETYCSVRGIRFARMTYQNREATDSALTEICIESRLDLLCLTYSKLLPPALVDWYAGRIINVHMGLLPAFKGLRAISDALQSGARFIGATIHEVDKEMDHGPIIAQCIEGVRQDDSEQVCQARLFNHLRLMCLQVIAWYAEGRVYKDSSGRILVKNARYGDLPVSPSVERSFP